MYTPEKGSKFIDTLDDIKGEIEKVDDPLINGKFHNNLKYKKWLYLFS